MKRRECAMEHEKKLIPNHFGTRDDVVLATSRPVSPVLGLEGRFSGVGRGGGPSRSQ